MNHLDIAPRHAGAIFGLGNTFATLAGLVSTPLTGRGCHGDAIGMPGWWPWGCQPRNPEMKLRFEWLKPCINCGLSIAVFDWQLEDGKSNNGVESMIFRSVDLVIFERGLLVKFRGVVVKMATFRSGHLYSVCTLW